MYRILRQLALLLAATWTTVSSVALDWPVQHMTIKAVPLQRTAETVFEFSNRSDQTVKITSIDTSCDCLDATPSASTFPPGAKGHITARFHFGDSAGVLHRTIIVNTDEDPPFQQLTVELEIPELATLSPRSVEWALNSAHQEQAIELQIAEGLELSVSSIHSTSENFSTRLEIVESGRHYRLYIAPKLTSTVANAAIRIYAKAQTGQAIVLSAYANVR